MCWFHEVIKQQQYQGTRMGIEHGFQWGIVPTTGNAANTAEAAAAWSTSASCSLIVINVCFLYISLLNRA
jgi:hypothetical protein